MAVFMITYDLNNSGKNYEDVIKAIKEASTGAWCTYWKSTYLIKSNLTANQVSEKITPFLDNDDRMIVVQAQKSYQGWLSEKEWEYIRENIFD